MKKEQEIQLSAEELEIQRKKYTTDWELDLTPTQCGDCLNFAIEQFGDICSYGDDYFEEHSTTKEICPQYKRNPNVKTTKIVL